MEIRKIQEMGGGTLLVSLPKEWAKKNRLSKGSFLGFEEVDGERLVVFPARDEEKKTKHVTIPYPADYMWRLVNSITGSYLLGCELIKIHGEERIKFEDREMMKKAIQQLVGLEIVEEDANSITAQFLVDPAVLDPSRVLRRMHMIVKGMCHDAVISVIESDVHLRRVARERDDEVDRLYFFLVRLLRSAVQDARLAARFKMSSIDCLDFRVASNLIEKVGDACVRITVEAERLPASDLDEQITGLLVSSEIHLGECLDLSLKGFFSKGGEESMKVHEQIEALGELVNRLETKVVSKGLQAARGIMGISSATNEIAKCCRDLADLSGQFLSGVEGKTYL